MPTCLINVYDAARRCVPERALKETIISFVLSRSRAPFGRAESVAKKSLRACRYLRPAKNHVGALATPDNFPPEAGITIGAAAQRLNDRPPRAWQSLGISDAAPRRSDYSALFCWAHTSLRSFHRRARRAGRRSLPPSNEVGLSCYAKQLKSKKIPAD
jgi:hypothetical protein